MDVATAYDSIDVDVWMVRRRYNAEFDERAVGAGAGAVKAPPEFDVHCKWPMPVEEIWQYMLEMNKKRTIPYKRSPEEKVFSFSHFLPRSDMPFEPIHPHVAKSVGCKVSKTEDIRGWYFQTF
jgi:hypothetical protein